MILQSFPRKSHLKFRTYKLSVVDFNHHKLNAETTILMPPSRVIQSPCKRWVKSVYRENRKKPKWQLHEPSLKLRNRSSEPEQMVVSPLHSKKNANYSKNNKIINRFNTQNREHVTYKQFLEDQECIKNNSETLDLKNQTWFSIRRVEKKKIQQMEQRVIEKLQKSISSRFRSFCKKKQSLVHEKKNIPVVAQPLIINKKYQFQSYTFSPWDEEQFKRSNYQNL